MKLKFTLIGLLALGAVASVPQSAFEQVRWVCTHGDVAGGGRTTTAPTASTLHRAFIPTGAGDIMAGTAGEPSGGFGFIDLLSTGTSE